MSVSNKGSLILCLISSIGIPVLLMAGVIVCCVQCNKGRTAYQDDSRARKEAAEIVQGEIGSRGEVKYKEVVATKDDENGNAWFIVKVKAVVGDSSTSRIGQPYWFLVELGIAEYGTIYIGEPYQVYSSEPGSSEISNYKSYCGGY